MKQEGKHHFYFEKGKRKLKRETDIKRLLNKITAFESVLGAISNDKDRFFLAFNRKRLIGSGSDLSSHSDISDTEYMIPFDSIHRRQ